MLRLVVVPCLNAHKRHVRDPLYFFNSLLAHVGRRSLTTELPTPVEALWALTMGTP